MKQLRGEFVWFAGKYKATDLVFCIGRVLKIERGNDFDIVIMNTGKGFTPEYVRKVYVSSSQARKQIATLKKNVMCLVFGYSKPYDFRQAKPFEMYAFVFWSAYVPNHFDRVDLEKEQVIDNDKWVAQVEEQWEKEVDEDFLTKFE